MNDAIKKYSTAEMEYEIAKYFNPRVNLIVPNVSWGMFFNHECDLLILTPSGYAYEVEIKVDKYDLRKDKEKSHHHTSKKIKGLYFGIPWYLENEIPEIPKHAGIISVGDNFNCRGNTKRLRIPEVINDYRFTDKEFYCLQRLGCMRIWTLKAQILGV